MVFSIQSFSNKVAYVAPRLRSSLQTFYGRHHKLIDRYKISICGSFPQMQIFIFPVSPTKLSQVTRRVLRVLGLCRFFMVSVSLLFLVFCFVFFVFVLCLVPNVMFIDCPFLMIPSIFSHIIVFYKLSHFLLYLLCKMIHFFLYQRNHVKMTCI